jgi:hypothetical protein
MALNTPLLFSVGFTLADLFLALEISVLVYSILTFFRTGRHSYLYLASAFLSLSILTKPVMLPLGIFITPVLLWLFFTRKYKWMVLTPIITLLSLVAFNTYYLGFPHFSSISAINRLQYNAGLMDNDRPESASGFTMKIPGTQAEYKEFYVQWNRQSTLLIRESPLEYFKIHIAGMGKMLLDPGRFEIYSFTHSNVPEVELTALLYKGKWKEVIKELGRNRLAFFLLIILSFVSLLKLFGLLFSLSLWKNYFFWVLAIIISYFLMVTGPVGAFRFAIPLQVFLCILSSYGLFKALNFFKVRSE